MVGRKEEEEERDEECTGEGVVEVLKNSIKRLVLRIFFFLKVKR